MRGVVVVLVLAVMLTACDRPPADGWGPVAETEALGEGDLSRLTVEADGKPLTLQVAGGVEVVQPVPDAAGRGFDVDGVGAYPGARYEDVDLRLPRLGRYDGARLLVKVYFVSDDAPEAVVAWYEKAFKAKGRPVQRDGLILNGQTLEGDDWTLVMKPDGKGSRGELRMRRQVVAAG
jgi:hypothetical protein